MSWVIFNLKKNVDHFNSHVDRFTKILPEKREKVSFKGIKWLISTKVNNILAQYNTQVSHFEIESLLSPIEMKVEIYWSYWMIYTKEKNNILSIVFSKNSLHWSSLY